jgi:hypothetical protein
VNKSEFFPEITFGEMYIAVSGWYRGFVTAG